MAEGLEVMPPHGHKRDLCKISTPGTVSGPYVNETSTWGSEIRCRYSKINKSEVPVSNLEIIDAEIRVPKGTTIAVGARVHLTKLRRTTLESDPTAANAILFDVVGTDWELPQELVLKCKQVRGGSLT